MALTNTQLSEQRTFYAKQRTFLANQRTYLAYMRTGFAISAIAGKFDQMWIALFGIIMILTSSIQYYNITYNLRQNNNIIYNEYLPLGYAPLSIIVLYLQYYQKKKD